MVSNSGTNVLRAFMSFLLTIKIERLTMSPNRTTPLIYAQANAVLTAIGCGAGIYAAIDGRMVGRARHAKEELVTTALSHMICLIALNVS